MTYIKWIRGSIAIAIACAVLAASAALHPAFAAPDAATGSLVTGSYTNAAGKLSYELYVPTTYKAGQAVPLIVALHGCTQTAAAFRKLSRFDDLAEAKGFIVVYPEQPKSSNQLSCWNWFKTEHLQRGAGEPSLIAGITGKVQEAYTVDPHRIYATGLSAGGAMAEVMAATYPDLYAAIGVGSGCEYTAGAACAGWQSADPALAGKKAYEAMGPRARAIPFMIFHGDKDTTVPPINAEQNVRAEQIEADLVDDGAQNGSVPIAPTKNDSGQVPGGRSYTISHYSDGHGHELGQFWLVHGMAHAWSGGNPAESYADPAGPNESAAMYDFFMSHPGP
jgi:poly(hydroxyalkanoate) depolymerase family esterase